MVISWSTLNAALPPGMHNMHLCFGRNVKRGLASIWTTQSTMEIFGLPHICRAGDVKYCWTFLLTRIYDETQAPVPNFFLLVSIFAGCDLRDCLWTCMERYHTVLISIRHVSILKRMIQKRFISNTCAFTPVVESTNFHLTRAHTDTRHHVQVQSYTSAY